MASHAEAPGRVLVGREPELAAVREVLNLTAEGQSETLLVFGEAGVGKTALVQHAVAGATPSTLLLSGACLPLQSISVPLLPLRADPAQPLLGGRTHGRWMGWMPSTGRQRCWMAGCRTWPAPHRCLAD
jgi:hypothetical protein